MVMKIELFLMGRQSFTDNWEVFSFGQQLSHSFALESPIFMLKSS